MTLSTPGSLDNANYIATDIPCTQIPKIIQQVTLYTTLTILNINYCSTIIYDTKLNFIMIIKSISLFRRFVLNYKFHHNFKKGLYYHFLQKGKLSVNFDNLLLNQSHFFKVRFKL